MDVEGFKFSAQSKQMLMEGLSLAINRREIRYPDGVAVNELSNFEYQYTATGVRYSAPPGLTDDVVCALALARQKREQELHERAELDEGGFVLVAN